MIRQKNPLAAQPPVIQPARRLSGINEYYFSAKLREIAQMRAAGKDVINLGIGSPDLPPAPETVETLVQHSRDRHTHSYQSYAGIPELRQAFAQWYLRWFGVSLNPDNEVLPLIGSKEGIVHIAMTYLSEGDEALVPNPGYPTSRAATTLAGAEPVEYELLPEKGWLPDLEALAQRDLSRVKIMWVNYPNMPTGTTAPSGFFQELIAFAKAHGMLLVNDNPYAFILNDNPASILAEEGAKDVALELNSLSKSNNMAGWRVGVLAGRADYLKEVLRFKSNMDSGMFKPLQLAAAHALQSPPEWYAQLNAVYRERRAYAYEILRLLGCSWEAGQCGLFVWAQVPEEYASGYELSDRVLHEAQVFLTPGGIFGSRGERYIRVSLCSDGALLEEALRRIRGAELRSANGTHADQSSAEQAHAERSSAEHTQERSSAEHPKP
jgi:LL-diaminopimelate aminotransferase